MIVQAVHKLLADAAAIGAVGIGIHYAERPERHALPAVVVQRGPNEHRHTLKGSAGRVRGIVRVTVLADDYLSAGDLKEKVRNRLDGYAGEVTVKDVDDQDQTVTIKYLKLDDEDDIPSDHRDGEGKIKTHGIQMDFRFAASESIPTLT